MDLTMSNFDNSIPEEMEEELKAQPNERIGEHAAYDHHGEVWWDGEQFVERVMVYGSTAGTYKADTLQELMDKVNEEHGSR